MPILNNHFEDLKNKKPAEAGFFKALNQRITSSF